MSTDKKSKLSGDQIGRILLALFGVAFVGIGVYHGVGISIVCGAILLIGALPWGKWTS